MIHSTVKYVKVGATHAAVRNADLYLANAGIDSLAPPDFNPVLSRVKGGFHCFRCREVISRQLARITWIERIPKALEVEFRQQCWQCLEPDGGSPCVQDKV